MSVVETGEGVEAIVGPDASGERTHESTTVRRRLVMLLPGHDPTSMDYHHGRFANQAGRFAKLWSFSTRVSPREDKDGELCARWSVVTSGANWRTRTSYEILRWDDIVTALDERSSPVRLWRGFVALSDFLVTGTALRYLKACVRYGLFFVFPIAVVALFAAVAVCAGWLVAALAGDMAAPWPWLIGLVAGVAMFFALVHQPGRRWRLHQALDDWDLARAYMRGRAPALQQRLDRFAEHVIERVRAGSAEEVLLVGHSLGATLAIGVLDRAFRLDPDLAGGQSRLALLTCGATIPKLALHPAGGALRAEAARVAARVAAAPGLLWAEYQSRHDAINFYKVHPVLLRRIARGAPTPPPLVRVVSIKQMLRPESFRRHRWHMMRIHYQFLLANERPADYDYFMLALGPLPFAELVGAEHGAVGRFGAEGRLIEPQPAPPLPEPAS